MDRMRDVPSEEYATLHDVWMMSTSKMVEMTTHKNMFQLYNCFICVKLRKVCVQTLNFREPNLQSI